MPSQETLSSVVNVIPTTEEKTPSFTVAVDWFFFFFFFSVAALCPPGSTYSPMTNSCIYLAAESHYPFFDTKTRTCSCCRWPRAIDTKELRRPERERERERESGNKACHLLSTGPARTEHDNKNKIPNCVCVQGEWGNMKRIDKKRENIFQGKHPEERKTSSREDQV